MSDVFQIFRTPTSLQPVLQRLTLFRAVRRSYPGDPVEGGRSVDCTVNEARKNVPI
jgi:hypothetical protein